MPNALIYYNKFKNLYKNNREEFKKRNGFFPFNIISNKNILVKEEFVKADHPITLEILAVQNKDTNDLFILNEIEKNIVYLNKEYFSIFYYSLLSSIWYIMSKKNNFKFVEEKDYEDVIFNLKNIFEFKNFNLIIKDKKLLKFFVEPKKILGKFKDEIL